MGGVHAVEYAQHDGHQVADQRILTIHRDRRLDDGAQQNRHYGCGVVACRAHVRVV